MISKWTCSSSTLKMLICRDKNIGMAEYATTLSLEYGVRKAKISDWKKSFQNLTVLFCFKWKTLGKTVYFFLF